MREYIRLFKFVRPHLKVFAAAVVCMVFSALFDGVSLGMLMPVGDIVLTGKKIVLPPHMPAQFGAAIDALNAVRPLAMLRFVSLAVIALFLLKGLFAFLQAYLMNDISLRVTRDVRSALFAKFQQLSLEYFTRMRGGELISRVTNDVGLISNAISYGATDFAYQSLQVLIFAVMILLIDMKLALLSLVLVPVIGLPMVKVGRMIKKIARQTQEKMADLNSYLFETIQGARVVRAFTMEKQEIKRFNDANNAYYKLSMRSVKRMQLLSPFTELIAIIAGVVVLWIKGIDVIEGRLSFGVLAVFLAALLSMIRPFKKLSQVNALMQQAIAGSIRIHEVLDARPQVQEKKGAGELTGFSDRIEYRDVSFSYGDHTVLQGINLAIAKGQALAVVGPSGAGKTTLLDLLPRFYDPQQGAVSIDGMDIRDLSFASLRGRIGIVTQETILFNDTIRNNIAFGMPQATAAEVEAAAKKAYIHDVIMRLAHGYDTVIGERGLKLSGGERQRIAIARALLKDAPILILDEATSQLDTESERLVQEAINLLIKGRTVLVIAHRLSTIKHVNRIVVLHEGRIVEEGAHDELLRRGGLYTRLYENQIHKEHR